MEYTISAIEVHKKRKLNKFPFIANAMVLLQTFNHSICFNYDCAKVNSSGYKVTWILNKSKKSRSFL